MIYCLHLMGKLKHSSFNFCVNLGREIVRKSIVEIPKTQNKKNLNKKDQPFKTETNLFAINCPIFDLHIKIKSSITAKSLTVTHIAKQ